MRAQKTHDFASFRKALREGDKHIFLLSGTEPYYIDHAYAALIKKLFPKGNAGDVLQVFSGDVDEDTVIEELSSLTFFSDKAVVVIKDPRWLRGGSKARETQEAATPEEPSARKDKKLKRFEEMLAQLPEYSYVIFLLKEKADKRKKLYKIIDQYGIILESEPVRAWNIDDWLEGKLISLNKDLRPDARAFFLGAVSLMPSISLSYLDQEFDKLALYSSDRQITKAELVRIFSDLPEVSVFAMLDAISARDARKALVVLHREMADGTYFTVLISLLCRHVRQLWLAREFMAKGIRGRALGQPLGLNPFIAEKLGNASRRFSPALLQRAYLHLCDADYAMKTGKGGYELLEQIVIELCRGE